MPCAGTFCYVSVTRIRSGLLAATLLSGTALDLQATHDGDLDPSFGSGGILELPASQPPGGFADLEVMPDGRMVLAGTTFERETTTFHILVARLLPDGTPDLSFGAAGYVVTDLPNMQELASGMAIQPNGKIVVVGITSNPYQSMVALRYDSNGSLDTTFAEKGWTLIDLGTDDSGASAVRLRTDGKIMVAGYAGLRGQELGYAACRLRTDGHLDSSFGDHGAFITPLSLSHDEVSVAFALQDDGKALISGRLYDPPYFYSSIHRLTANGRLDQSFGNQGELRIRVDDFTPFVQAIAVDPVVRVLLTGETYQVEGRNLGALVRLTARGRPDSSFDLDGKALFTIPSLVGVSPFKLALQTDGKILAAGTGWTAEGANRLVLARYFPDGGLDLAFGELGVQVTSLPNASFALSDLEWLPSGKAQLAGSAIDVVGDLNPRSVLVRTIAGVAPDSDYFFETLPDRVAPGGAVQILLGLRRTPGSPPPYRIRLHPSELELTIAPGEFSILAPPWLPTGSSRITLESLDPEPQHLERGVVVEDEAHGAIAIRAMAPYSIGSETRSIEVRPGEPIAVVLATTTQVGDLYGDWYYRAGSSSASRRRTSSGR
jgi:uncharacterized delta-60 repeat protein